MGATYYVQELLVLALSLSQVTEITGQGPNIPTDFRNQL